MVGYFAYDLVRRLERLPELAVDDLQLPDMVMLLATDLAAVDHHEGTITLIANAVNWNGTDETRRLAAYDDAVARLDVMTEALVQPLHSTVATFTRPTPVHRLQWTPRSTGRSSRNWSATSRPARRSRWCPSQRFEMTTPRTRSTSTGCCGCPTQPRTCTCSTSRMCWGTAFSIVGSSPEALVTVVDGWATTHPIAGTRWRGATEERTSCWRRSCWPTRGNAPST